ncbi:Hsp70 nucleotide exchange factor FES1 KNAG_0J02540 [Huiozyma naganishii CBS 8797]|uniref:Hsp70 nucleotide exchange factor FES1 n=1 Tax=Huiozyma naganishii (strain ATCC MYA-139 / BCRC 22969 / CBS 8797 / KCTC 17520 / NBRC 10181 / NCYC 3082 / Yp74L-3) TaxID=1071383 RepID=J7RR58_HUIN7|nr:hypothetical protein KNAG_0J02540 [Kazachstania naganishii CBS 8797]CCK72333.1 hypothetical protein KNAG_0J02540 [Kazachstania naganishii CBS 8797]
MEKLLHWSIANSQGDKEAIAKAGAPDPKLLEQLFGGGNQVDDATLMKECTRAILDDEVELENKLTAMDNFEMLIENLDNANNIENMKLWEPILKMLDFEEAELRQGALSIIGTAVQNNSTSQDNFIKYDTGLEKVIKLAGDMAQPNGVRTKALYALSNLTRNHPAMAEKFEQQNGLDIVPVILNDPKSEPKLKMRVIALITAFISTVTVDDKLLSLLRKDGVIQAVAESFLDETNINIVDRVLAFFSRLIACGVKFTNSELVTLRKGFEQIQPLKDRLNEDDYLSVKYVL